MNWHGKKMVQLIMLIFQKEEVIRRDSPYEQKVIRRDSPYE